MLIGQGMVRSAPGRSRTFTGCRTCRSRHLKCDEARPTCSTCLRLDITCEGYEARLLWVDEQQDDGSPAKSSSHAMGPGSHRAASYRYPLFTEPARSAMSKQLVRSLGSRTSSEVLQHLDTLDAQSALCHLAGPFGVFWPGALPDAQTASQTATSIVAVAPEPTVEREEADEEILSDALPAVDDSCLDPALHAGLHRSWVDDDGNVDQELFDEFMASGLFVFSTPRSPRTPVLSGIPSPVPSLRDGRLADHSNSHSHTRVSSRLSSPVPFFSTLPREVAMPSGHTRNGISIALPASAAPLIRFYKHHLLGASTTSSPLKARASLWKILILPRALETFAELSLWNTASHTRCCIFYCLLARSALQLAQSPDTGETSSSEWMGLAENHQVQAQVHLKRALQYEYDGEEPAEYTDLLMALLATAMVSIQFHGPRVAGALLIDGERLMRLRSHPVRKTYNARMLHHTYTHLRILVESTRRPSLLPTREPTVIDAVDNRSLGGTDILRNFLIAEDCLGTDLDLTLDKPPDVGYSDFHLEVSGNWPPTLYPEIFGLPESLMTLLSQTLSLANSRPHLDAMAATDSSISVALSQHIKTLEQNIWSWTVDSSASLPAGPSRPDGLLCIGTQLWEHPQTRSMILAMHQGLIIYFYRRIYRMSAMVIQDAVRKALDYLEECLDSFLPDQDFAAAVAWCSFIAACEAVAPDLQVKALACLHKTDHVGAVFATQKPSEVAVAVWEQRKRTGDWTYSWLDHSIMAA